MQTGKTVPLRLCARGLRNRARVQLGPEQSAASGCLHSAVAAQAEYEQKQRMLDRIYDAKYHTAVIEDARASIVSSQATISRAEATIKEHEYYLKNILTRL